MTHHRNAVVTNVPPCCILIRLMVEGGISLRGYSEVCIPRRARCRAFYQDWDSNPSGHGPLSGLLRLPVGLWSLWFY
jgi:hypothetical protein